MCPLGFGEGVLLAFETMAFKKADYERGGGGQKMQNFSLH